MQSGVIKRMIAAFKDVEGIVDMCEEVSKLLHSLSVSGGVSSSSTSADAGVVSLRVQ